jgi:hypothetical protein
VTILMPCRAVYIPFLRQALHSVLGQTSPGWRLSIITHADDHRSRQAIAAALAELGASAHARIARLETEGMFVTAALNAGMRHVQTPYVAVLHADDLLARRAVETLTTAIRCFPEVDYFHSSHSYIDESGRRIGLRRARSSFTLSDFKKGSPVKHLHCWRVAAALAIGGMDESLGLHAADDYDFPWCMADAGSSFKAIPDVLYHYRDHRAHYRLTTHVPLDVQVAETKRILAKHGLNQHEIELQISRRTAGYLRQALYRDEEDRRQKELAGYDISQGWREPH